MGAPRFNLNYDLRNPDEATISNETLYDGYFDQMVWAESLGYDGVWLAESHFSGYGEIPSVLPALAAVAARTSRITIGTGLLVMPLHHPIRLAEDAAFLSILSKGRFILGVGAGSHEQDFAAFGHQLKQRPSLMDEAVEILRRSWAGEPFSFSGKRWSFPEIQVKPLPTNRNIPIYIGAFSKPAIERAARIGDGYLCGFEAGLPVYLDALSALGKDPAQAKVVKNQWSVIAEDPEREWAHIGPIAMRQLNNYVSEGLFGPDARPFADPADVLARGPYTLWDGPTAVKEIRALMAKYPQIVDFSLFAQIPGETVDHANPRLEFIASKVLPELRKPLN